MACACSPGGVTMAHLGARRVANGDPAVAGGLRPVFQVQVELPEIVAPGVEPGLSVRPALELHGRVERSAGNQHFAQVRDPLAEQRAIGHHCPLAIADDFPSIEIFAVEHGLPIGSHRPGGRQGEKERGAQNRGFHSFSIGFGTNRMISDTHGLLRPEAVEALRGSDLIIHAGDVGDAAILEALRRVAPVTAVRGKYRSSAAAETAVVEGVYVLHNIRDLDLDPAAAGYRAVVSGHSRKHGSFEKAGVLYINPGSAGSTPVSLADYGCKAGFGGVDRGVCRVAAGSRWFLTKADYSTTAATACSTAAIRTAAMMVSSLAPFSRSAFSCESTQTAQPLTAETARQNSSKSAGRRHACEFPACAGAPESRRIFGCWSDAGSDRKKCWSSPSMRQRSSPIPEPARRGA